MAEIDKKVDDIDGKIFEVEELLGFLKSELEVYEISMSAMLEDEDIKKIMKGVLKEEVGVGQLSNLMLKQIEMKKKMIEKIK